MAAIGSLVFCTDCGTLLDRSNDEENAILVCDVCGAHCKDTSAKSIIFRSKPSAFPSFLRSMRSEVQTVDESEVKTMATIKHPCEKCGRKEVKWYEQQLRGVDEGSTIFYVCECGNKWSVNN